jgi:thiamine biosynthesis lipoprotein
VRPPGLRLDSGGLAKGLFCDLLGEMLAAYDAFAVDCAGDVLVGGSAKTSRSIQVANPFDDSVLHAFESDGIAAATSGIGRRSWIDSAGRAAHHLLDPSTGRPAFTGIVQATAFAPHAASAEIYAKAALLSGPRVAPEWLPHGGVIVFEDGDHEVIAAGSDA